MQTLKLVKTGRVCQKQPVYSSILDVVARCCPMRHLDREHFVVLHLDAENRMLAKETISIGDLTSAIIHPREVFKGAVHHGSAAIICVHNHPGGDNTPSEADISITRRLIECGELLGIKVLDHVIIGNGFSSVNDYVSFQKMRKTH